MFSNLHIQVRVCPQIMSAWSKSEPPENCHLNVKKLPKTCHFFNKNCHFSKNCQWQFFEKNDNFLQFFGKRQVFGNVLTLKWQFSRGLGMDDGR